MQFVNLIRELETLNREVPEVGTYFSVLRTIAHGNVKPRDIAAALEVKMPNLVHYLKVLSDMDILCRTTPITESNPEKSKKDTSAMFMRKSLRNMYSPGGWNSTGSSMNV